MPRPKPAVEIKTRAIRLSDQQWKALTVLGGAAWLRELLSAPNPSGFTVQQRDRINRIKADSAFLSVARLAAKYKLSEATVKAHLK